MASDSERAVVQVVYARPDEQPVVEVDFEPGMTAADAVERSGLLSARAAVAEAGLLRGVWGVEVALAHRLRAGDRVEISRPLQADPRAMRRELLTDGRVMGGAPAPGGKIR
jgi:putative ubiquitin-RnfH superfamily antitoxin RatB of RatAB toxin-antitoxin module